MAYEKSKKSATSSGVDHSSKKAASDLESIFVRSFQSAFYCGWYEREREWVKVKTRLKFLRLNFDRNWVY